MTALAGLRVLDLTRLLPGGFCSLLLDDFGADVIKVEDTGAGDCVRWAEPRYPGAEPSAAAAPFLALNRGKRSVRIDLKTDAGREVLLALARDADVLLESFRPGVLDRLGVGWERLRAQNPRLVYCAITGYGQDGPYRDRAGHDTNYLALAGLLGMTGTAPDGPPVQAAGQIADLGGGALMAAFGILAALRERDRSGEGQLVDVSMTDGALGVGAVLAVAGDRAVDDARVRLAHPLVADPEPVEHAGAEAVEDDVVALDQAQQRLAPGLALEVEADRALAAVEREVERRARAQLLLLVRAVIRRRPADVVAHAGVLHL